MFFSRLVTFVNKFKSNSINQVRSSWLELHFPDVLVMELLQFHKKGLAIFGN
jgi:hypothetical protein